MTTLDFELEIGPATNGTYPVTACMPGGETTTFRWPWTLRSGSSMARPCGEGLGAGARCADQGLPALPRGGVAVAQRLAFGSTSSSHILWAQ
jgi:hypothetical protein